MNVLSTLTLKNLKLNKSRTIVTIVGIILSTALLVGLSGLVSSFFLTLEKMAIADYGQQHVTFLNVPKCEIDVIKLNKETKNYYLIECFDSFGYGDELCEVVAMDENALDENKDKLVEGRLPTNSSEILISNNYLYKNIGVGDNFTIPNGETHKVVGKIEGRTKGVVTTNPVILYMDEIKEDACVCVTYKNPKNYEKITKNIVGDSSLRYDYNSSLLRIQAGVMSDSNNRMIFAMAIVLAIIIITTSVFCIRNSFAISITEKIRQYGMLASVGATPKQIRKNVLFEGFILGLIGVPIGVLSGCLAVVVLMKITNALVFSNASYDSFMQVSINPLYVLVGVLLASVTIYFSALGSALRAGRVCEIEAIRSTTEIKVKAKSLKTPKWINKCFGIGGVFAYKNLKRNKRKFRTTTISLVVSIATFIAMSSFFDIGVQTSKVMYSDYLYNLQVFGEDADKIYDELDNISGINEKNLLTAYPQYLEAFSPIDGTVYAYDQINFIKMDDEYYKKYLKQENINDDNVFVLLDKGWDCDENGRRIMINRIKSENEVTVLTDFGDSPNVKENTFNFIRPENYPMGINVGNMTCLLMSNSQFEKYALDKEKVEFDGIYLNCEAPYEVESEIREYAEQKNLSIKIYNIEETKKAQENGNLVIAIFLYGFIGVIILVGLTNIFNSLSTNMSLRQKEFATLMSVGMTKKEFSKMVSFEAICYVLKSLLWGIPLGLLGSFGIYKATSYGMIDFAYNPPILQIIICAVVVFFVVYSIMKASLGKISKQNIIETIRNENI